MTTVPPSAQEAVYSPDRLDEFIGQRQLVRQLIPEIKASIHEGRAIASQCWHGGAGLGKSTLAELLGKIRGVNVILHQGSKLKERDLDIFFRLKQDPNVHPHLTTDFTGYECLPNPANRRLEWRHTGTRRPCILVINEADLVPKKIHQNMQDVTTTDAKNNRYYQSNYDGRSVDVFAPDMTTIYITNYMDQMLKNGGPNMSRCSIVYKFVPYETGDLVTILKQFAAKVKIGLEPAAAEHLAEISHGTPRQALILFGLAKNILSAHHYDKKVVPNTVTLDIVNESLDQSGHDQAGLDSESRQYLQILFAADKKTMAVERIANMMGEVSSRPLELMIEPKLFRMGYVTVAAGRGRQLTHVGVEYCTNLMFSSPNPGGVQETAVASRY